MPEGEDGMGEYHARTGKSHYLFDPGAHLGLATVDLAFRAGGLIAAVRAFA